MSRSESASKSSVQSRPSARGGKTSSFRDLIAYQRALDLCEACYQLAETFPGVHQRVLADQIRRASSSVPMNISEGFGLGTRPQFLKHLRSARGSLCEVSTALELVERLKVRPRPNRIIDQADEALRILQGLISSIERSTVPPPNSPARTSKRN
jgi:four helix bundle protein